MPGGKGTYGSQVGRPKKMMYGGKVKKMAMGGKASCPMKMRGGGVIEEIKESINSANPAITERLAKMAGMNPAGMRPKAPVKLGMEGQIPQKDIV